MGQSAYAATDCRRAKVTMATIVIHSVNHGRPPGSSRSRMSRSLPRRRKPEAIWPAMRRGDSLQAHEERGGWQRETDDRHAYAVRRAIGSLENSRVIGVVPGVEKQTSSRASEQQKPKLPPEGPLESEAKAACRGQHT